MGHGRGSAVGELLVERFVQSRRSVSAARQQSRDLFTNGLIRRICFERFVKKSDIAIDAISRLAIACHELDAVTLRQSTQQSAFAGKLLQSCGKLLDGLVRILI